MSRQPQEMGGPERVQKVLGAMEKHMNNVTGFKRGHARGVAFRGYFQATPEAAALTTAEHLQGDRIETVVRVSNGGSSPYLADRESAEGATGGQRTPEAGDAVGGRRGVRARLRTAEADRHRAVAPS